MKKAVSLSFLLFANIILLVHTAVPHHHHNNGSPCFLDTHCKDGKETHSHKHSNPHPHEHDEIPFSEKCCFIDNAYIPAHNHVVKTACHIHTKCHCGQMLHTMFLHILNRQDFVDETEIHFRQNPFVPLFYSEFVSQSNGLRAPPVC